MSIKRFWHYVTLIKASMAYFAHATGHAFYIAGIFLAASRIMQTAAFFMPLKVLIVLSVEDGLQKYSQFVGNWLTEQQFLIAIVALVPISYLLYIAFGALYRIYYDLDYQQQLAALQQHKREEKWLKQVKHLYPKIVKVWSDLFSTSLILFVLLLIHPVFALILLMIVMVNLLYFERKVFDKTDTHRLTMMKLDPRQFVEYVISANYLLVFLVLVVGVLYTDIGVLTAIFGLLLARVCLQGIQRFVLESRHLKEPLNKFIKEPHVIG